MKEDTTPKKGILGMMDEMLVETKDEFVQHFTEILKIVKEVKDTSSKEWSDLKIAISKIKDELSGSNQQSQAELRSQIENVLQGQIRAVEAKIATIKDGYTPIKGKDYFDGLPADEIKIVEDVLKRIPPPTIVEPNIIRDRLETLKGEERLDASAIKGLKEELAGLKQQMSMRGGVIMQRGAVKAHDLSSELNGVLKTFTLPAFWRVISVHLSSFPSILRPTIDYTTDASAMTITFTSEINAASSLATGQSLIIVYAEP